MQMGDCRGLFLNSQINSTTTKDKLIKLNHSAQILLKIYSLTTQEKF